MNDRDAEKIGAFIGGLLVILGKLAYHFIVVYAAILIIQHWH